MRMFGAPTIMITAMIMVTCNVKTTPWKNTTQSDNIWYILKVLRGSWYTKLIIR